LTASVRQRSARRQRGACPGFTFTLALHLGFAEQKKIVRVLEDKKIAGFMLSEEPRRSLASVRGQWTRQLVRVHLRLRVFIHLRLHVFIVSQ